MIDRRMNIVVLFLIVGFLLIGCEEPDTTAPTVSVSYPAHGTSVSGVVNVTCIATDNVGVEKVELWIDGVSTGLTDDTEPYSFTWNTTQYEDGSTHVITVRACDVNDNKSDSNPITVTVDQTDALPLPGMVYPIEINSDSYTIKWAQNQEDDFNSYELRESLHQNMDNSTLVYASTTANDTSHTITGLVMDENRYYQIVTIDNWGLSSISNIELYFISSSFMSVFGGSDSDAGRFVQQTSDGGFIISGTTQSFGSGSDDAWLIKVDIMGNEEWNKTFGGANIDYGHCVKQTNDGGYIIAGATRSFGNGNYDAYLIKTDANGDEQWNRTFGGVETDYANSIHQSTDGGYILAGITQSTGNGNYDFWLIKTNTNGDEEWNRTYGGTNQDYCSSMDITTDGGFILVGNTRSFGNGGSDIWLLKVDGNGSEEWSKTFGGTAEDYGYLVQQITDGGFIIAGATYSLGAGSQDIWLIKTDASGDKEWNKSYGGSDNDFYSSAQQTIDGGLIVAGSTLSFGNGLADIMLIKTDAGGVEEWSRFFGGDYSDQAFCVKQTTDSGYILTGSTVLSDGGEQNVWLIKTDAQGSVPSE